MHERATRFSSAPAEDHARDLAPCEAATCLLIVQKNGFAARSLGRYLSLHFGEVLVAETPARAEAYLTDPCRRVTHVVSGQDFGEDAETGEELIARWRSIHPSLRRAVLATGALEVPRLARGVDAIFLKPAQPAELLAMLLDDPISAPRHLPPPPIRTSDRSQPRNPT